MVGVASEGSSCCALRIGCCTGGFQFPARSRLRWKLAGHPSTDGDWQPNSALASWAWIVMGNFCPTLPYMEFYKWRKIIYQYLQIWDFPANHRAAYLTVSILRMNHVLPLPNHTALFSWWISRFCFQAMPRIGLPQTRGITQNLPLHCKHSFLPKNPKPFTILRPTSISIYSNPKKTNNI